jgi:uroporphyrinogen-III decarboxylase
LTIDFTAHNEEQKAVWDAYRAGDPIRMPMILGINCRFWLLNPDLNTTGISFREYTEDPDIMFDSQLKFTDYRRNNLYEDAEMGDASGSYRVAVDFQNSYEALWYGAEIAYRDGNVPDTLQLLPDDRKNLLFESGFPDPFGGWGAIGRDYYEKMKERADKTLHHGRPITVGAPYMGTDGPFSVACNLRGATEFCLDIYDDIGYYRQMMEYLTESIIFRMKAWRKYMGQAERSASFSFADDSIALLSTEMYRELVLPYHKRIFSALSTGEKPNFIHLCGDAGRHFKLIRDELNVTTFDTGFPLDHAKILDELGPDVAIYGGVPVGILQHGNPSEVVKETERIIKVVKDKTKKFVFREANNLSPNTPVANLQAMYSAVKEFGRYK